MFSVLAKFIRYEFTDVICVIHSGIIPQQKQDNGYVCMSGQYVGMYISYIITVNTVLFEFKLLKGS